MNVSQVGIPSAQPMLAQQPLQLRPAQFHYVPASQAQPGVPAGTQPAQSTQNLQTHSVAPQVDATQANPHPWQVVTVHQSARRTAIPNLQQSSPVPTNNRYSALSEDGDCDVCMEQDSKPRTPRPPPVFIHGVLNYEDMINNITQILETEQFSSKSLSDGSVKLNTYTPESYRSLIRHLNAEKIVYHTYQVKDERAYRVVLRNIHPSIDVDYIKEGLREQGHRVRNIMNIRHRVSKTPLPLFFVDLEPASNNKDIYNLKYIFNMQITVEPPKKKNAIIQCTRCQAYGHSKSYCTRPYQCVKCAGDHPTATCSRSKSSLTPATCALCKGPHPANYKGCEVYQKLLTKRGGNTNNPRTDRATETMQPSTSSHNYNADASNVTHRSYAQVAAARLSPADTAPKTLDLSHQHADVTLTQFLSRFEAMFQQLMAQNSTMLTLLTRLVTQISP